MKTTVKSKWDQIMEVLKSDFGLTKVSFDTWLSPLKVYEETDNKVTLLIDDIEIVSYNSSFIKNKYGIFIKQAIEEVTGKSYELAFITPNDMKEFDQQSQAKKEKETRHSEQANLNPRYTFDTFVVGSNNKLAHAASLAVAESPAEAYNPLFIYGGVGLGKTHLMHSIAHFILDQTPESKVLYVTSENFTNELITSIREGNDSTTEFRRKYRNIDVLLIDDIQFIIGKESTQEEFFHTFNTLHESKKQIIISSDKPPKEFTTLEERLRSRFEWGLSVDIQQPDYETRMAILKKKEELEGLSIADEVMEYIASNIKSNIRELEGALTKIVALSKLEKREVNVALAEEALQYLISPDNKKEITADSIIQVVADQYNLNPSDIISTKKSKNIAYPRQITMYLCRSLLTISLSDIGKALGGRDHTTVIHGIEKITKDLEVEKRQNRSELANRLDIIKKKLNP
ncbi:MAG: chromosomal replication initiator protein DnaA [Lachnospiraceae bacterium]|jgi:chromosomal replication initiator protein|nr:chromosomal replication initiator protein DnaA [Lachnospiraceae bacterium]